MLSLAGREFSSVTRNLQLFKPTPTAFFRRAAPGHGTDGFGHEAAGTGSWGGSGTGQVRALAGGFSSSGER